MNYSLVSVIVLFAVPEGSTPPPPPPPPHPPPPPPPPEQPFNTTPPALKLDISRAKVLELTSCCFQDGRRNLRLKF